MLQRLLLSVLLTVAFEDAMRQERSLYTDVLATVDKHSEISV